ncbi:MAG: transporter [Gemmatimonadaceae bacterium]
MRRLSFLPVFLLAFAMPLDAQKPVAKDSTAAKTPPAIEDNSFLIEEAFNQEYGVVQHISTFQRTKDGSWGYSFTQEWPAPSIKHQLSYTVPVYRANRSTGIGDIALNYRYQALGADGAPLLFAPRLSLYLPTGDVTAGRGAGGPGLEVMLPVSYQLNDAFITHWNAGASLTRADNGLGVRGTARGLKVGASVIWLVAPTFNLMLESIATRGEALDENGKRESFTSYIVSPGMRAALNFASGLQIVPGIAFPIGVGSSRGQRDVFLYLSFEHSFR